MIQQPVASTQSPPRRTRRRWPIWQVVLGALLLVALALLVYRGVRLGLAGWRAYTSATQVLTTVRDDELTADLPAAVPVLRAELDQLAGDLAALRVETGPLEPWLPYLRGLPEIGTTVAAAPQLLDSGQQLLALSQETLTLLGPALSVTSTATNTLEQVSAVLAAAAPSLPELLPRLQAARSALSDLPANALPDSLSEPLGAAPAALDLAMMGAELGPALPSLLGMEQPRTYLLLVQNNHELRATGGFIAAVGRLKLDKGRILEMVVQDSYRIYNKEHTYPPAPKPMQQYMNIPILLMRDANWSPDLPTAAQVARALYAQQTGIQVDGIITLDIQAVKHIVGALGSLRVDGAEEPITRENIEQQLISFWEQPLGADETKDENFRDWLKQRKDFIPAIAKTALQRLQRGNVDFLALAAALQAALTDRSIQVWLQEPTAQAVLSTYGWDGGLHPVEGQDFLAVVDTNMGYNKVDAAMQRALSYQVTWPADASQPATATLTLTYTHPIQAEDPGCDLTPRYGDKYADMIARCYFDYVRVFVPLGSALAGADGLEAETVVAQRGEQRTQLIAGYFILQPGFTHSITFTYTLPAEIRADGYQLRLQRQAGTGPLPVTLQVGSVVTSTVVSAGMLDWVPTPP